MFRPSRFWRRNHGTDLTIVPESQTRGIITDSPAPAFGLYSPTSNSSEPIAATCCRTAAAVLPVVLFDCRHLSAEAFMPQTSLLKRKRRGRSGTLKSRVLAALCTALGRKEGRRAYLGFLRRTSRDRPRALQRFGTDVAEPCDRPGR